MKAVGGRPLSQMLPVYSDLDSFLVAACKLKKLADVNNAVVRPIKLASVVVVTTYGQVISIEVCQSRGAVDKNNRHKCDAIPPQYRNVLVSIFRWHFHTPRRLSHLVVNFIY